MCSCFLRCLIILILFCGYVFSRMVTHSNCPRVYLRNGRIRMKQRGRFLKFSCNTGFILAGERYSICQTDGTWDMPAPKCVKPTCNTKTQQPPSNGLIFPSHGGGVLNFYCKPGYKLRGSSVMFCDGIKWDNHPPTCFPSDRLMTKDGWTTSDVKPQLFCDFEKDDICQWTQDWNHDFDWIRENYQTPSGAIGTGPSFDHTKGESGKNGYYMYIESSSRRENDTARLISPVFDKMTTNTCLEFWYHMYGATTGTLRAYVKKVSQPLPLDPKKAIFSKNGNQGNKWYRSFHNLGTIDEEFQIIMEGVRGNGYVSDIAIDDVKLIENCVYEDHILITTEEPSTSITEVLKTVESCDNRCGHKATGNEGNTIISCDCDDSCFDNNRCCPDYWDMCFISSSTYLYDSYSTPNETNFNQELNFSVTSTTSQPVIFLTTTQKTQTTSIKYIPVKTVTQPTLKPLNPAIKPEKHIIKPEKPSIKPTEAIKPVIKPVRPFTEPEKPIIKPTQPVKPVIKPTKPVKPVIKPINPVIESTKPVTEPVKPIIRPIQPVIKPEKPIIKPIEPVKPVIIKKPYNTQRPLIFLTTPTTEKIIRKFLPNNTKDGIKNDDSLETNDVNDVPSQRNEDKSEDKSMSDDFESINEKEEDVPHYDENEEFAKEFDTPYLKSEHGEGIKTIKGEEDTSNVKTIFITIVVACGVVVIMLFSIIMLVKFKIIKMYRLKTGNGTTSQSDVRFLTADEALDFSMDSASISSSTF